MKMIDLTNQIFGRLTALARAQNSPSGRIRWFCECSCGKTATPTAHELRKGDTKSCGCLRAETATIQMTKHGMSHTRTHDTWMRMLWRCTAESEDRINYFDRGIRVCERWQDFKNFLADMGPKPEGLSIDRINNDGGYEPGNCRWATPVQQARNTRQNRHIIIDGVTKLLCEWSALSGVSQSLIRERLNHGWDPARAVFFKGDGRHTRGKNGT